MTQQSRKENKDERAARQCGMTVQEWRAVRKRATTEKTRGRRPTGSGAETTLAGWGAVEGQMPLFPAAVTQDGTDS